MNEPVSMQNYAQLITISEQENDASEIESHLRESGLPVRMTWLKPTDDLAKELKSVAPDIVFCDETTLKKNAELLLLCTRTLPYTPVLLLARKLSADKVTQALHQRARDVVSVNQPDHLHAVYLRELGVCRLQQHLNMSREEIEALEERLEGLISSSEAAVATVQEGIIVDANPQFASLFGFGNPADAAGLPFMDYIHADSLKDIKKRMSRCLKGKSNNEKAEFKAATASGEDFKAELEIKLVHFEGEAAIEVQIKSLATEQVAEEPPVEKEAAPEAQTEEKAEVKRKPSKTKPKPAPKSEPAEVDPRTRLYQSLENPKHYPPNGQGLSLGFFVVDNSVKLKQELGLANAEQFLGRITTFLNKQLPGAKVFRLATEEFVLIAPGELFKHGESLSRNFCKQISEEIFDYAGKSVVFTVSIAITLIDAAKNSGERFAEARDEARKLSASGGNAVTNCAPATTSEQTDDPIEWQGLQDALSKNRLRLATRPIASLEGDNRHYYELYPRLPNEKGEHSAIEGGGPQDTHSKLQIELDRKLLLLSLGMLKKAQGNNQKTGVFVPISSCSLEEGEEAFSWLWDQYQKLGLKEQEIVLTITEDVLTPHIHRLKELIQKESDKPIRFAISDCDGDEQSLRLIQNLPGSFLRLTEDATRALCSNKKEKTDGLHEAVSIAREHGYKIIAAATGDAHSMAVLWQLGVNYVESPEIEEPAAA